MQRAERVKERAAESKQLLVEAVRKSELGGDETKAVDFEDMPDDDDNVDELEEYEVSRHALNPKPETLNPKP